MSEGIGCGNGMKKPQRVWWLFEVFYISSCWESIVTIRIIFNQNKPICNPKVGVLLA